VAGDAVMSVQVGIDLVSAEEVRDSLAHLGDRYRDRIYTEAELRECGADVLRLAARFAAKEATMKALRRKDEPLPWRSIGVTTDAVGRPCLELTGPAATLARERRVIRLSVSLTDEAPSAAAIVFAEVEER
jgi:holo-[acyl-carrier protein] synthase